MKTLSTLLSVVAIGAGLVALPAAAQESDEDTGPWRLDLPIAIEAGRTTTIALRDRERVSTTVMTRGDDEAFDIETEQAGGRGLILIRAVEAPTSATLQVTTSMALYVFRIEPGPAQDVIEVEESFVD